MQTGKYWVHGATALAIGMASASPLAAATSAATSEEILRYAPHSRPALPGTALPGITETILDDDSYIVAFSDGNTAAIVRALNEVRAECGSIPAEYRIDCLGQGLQWASRRVNNPDYRRANGILNQAGRQLRTIARRNADSSKPDLSANTSDNAAWKTPRKYKAVRRDRLASAVSEARSVIDNAVAKLLRAAESSDKRRVHYTKIANALASTKSLLRSS